MSAPTVSPVSACRAAGGPESCRVHGRSRQGLDSPPATRKGFQEAISDLLGEDMPERAKGRQRRSWGVRIVLWGADFEVVSRKVPHTRIVIIR